MSVNSSNLQDVPSVIQKAINECQNASFTEGGSAILDLDVTYFCTESKSGLSSKVQALTSLLKVFVAIEDPKD